MSKTEIHTAIDGPYASITFRSENGICVASSELLRSLGEALGQVRSDESVRSLVIRSEGKVFLAGADIKEMAGFSFDAARGYAKLGQSVLADLESMPVITVAAINGAAMGGGLELALACDFRLAVKTARIGLPEASLGLIPGWAGIPRLVALVGPSRAKRLFLSAVPVTAEEGLAFGLVDEIVNSAEDLDARVPVFCRSFRRGSPTAVALCKRAFQDGDDVSAFAECFDKPDSKEGIEAFVGKRPARWME